jgi:hypothetical protein
MKFFSETECVPVPKYVCETFNRRLSPQDQASERIKKMGERVNRLIAQALEGLPHADWIISNTKYQSPNVHEPLGLESDGLMTYVYGEERGQKSPIAIFKDDHMAAKYFVWLVSKGKREIDWSLFLDMEI